MLVVEKFYFRHIIVKFRSRSGEGLSQDNIENVVSFSSWYLSVGCLRFGLENLFKLKYV